VLLEDADDCVDDLASDRHLVREEVSGSFGWFNLKFSLRDYLFLLAFGLCRFLFLRFLLHTERILVFEKKRDLIFGFSDERLAGLQGVSDNFIFILGGLTHESEGKLSTAEKKLITQLFQDLHIYQNFFYYKQQPSRFLENTSKDKSINRTLHT
jgi:hypothetical protein